MLARSKRMKVPTPFLVLSIACLALLPPSPPAASAAGHDALVQQIETTLPGQMQKFNVPGVSIALIEDGEIVYLKNLGLADRENRIPVTRAES